MFIGLQWNGNAKTEPDRNLGLEYEIEAYVIKL